MTPFRSERLIISLAVLFLCTACASGPTADVVAVSEQSAKEEEASAEEKSRLLQFRNSILAVVRTVGGKLTGKPANAVTNSNESTTTTVVPASSPVPPPAPVATVAFGSEPVNPILFVTQTPIEGFFAIRTSSFANHFASPQSAPRGGDLMIRYPDGTLRNLTKEAGFGMDGQQGANAIAVREPSVFWDGTKAVFSMVIGAPSARYQVATYYWQLYEVTGLAKGETARITKVDGQPINFNNLSPTYATNGNILFTSDSPANGERHLYPQLDEYESTATVTGIWSYDPVQKRSRRLNHTISGAFNPVIDSYGRVIFVRWDHLQRDQQADAQKAGVANYGAINFSNETATASRMGLIDEVFPEPRTVSQTKYGPVNSYTSNFFMPWQMNEDGTDEVTLNHVGRHEFFFQFMPRSFMNDTALADTSNATFRANTFGMRGDAGTFQLREDPTRPGTFFGIHAREFGPHTANTLIEFNAPYGLSAEKIAIRPVSVPEDPNTNFAAGGRYRSPLPLSNGVLVAVHSPFGGQSLANPGDWKFRIKSLAKNASGFWEPKTMLTAGITKSVTWFDPDNVKTHNGEMWELDPVEVRVTTKPTPRQAPPIETPERQILTEEQVDETELRNWLRSNNLALIITRDNTSRDRADVQQPFNLAVPNGVRSVTSTAAKVYEISHFQIFQADMLRGYQHEGRRPLATPSSIAASKNPTNPGPTSSVKIATDGSSAAFVPAGKALTWQTTDLSGEPVVRERNWVTFQAGEVRTCAGCHGANEKDQLDRPSPTNKPEALRQLLRHWKTIR